MEEFLPFNVLSSVTFFVLALIAVVVVVVDLLPIKQYYLMENSKNLSK